MTSAPIPRATSMTHQHLLALANTRIAGLRETTDVIRICDMGCGDGQLLGFLAHALPQINPDLRFEFSGVEVSDSGVQPAGFFDATVTHLASVVPEIDWRSHLHMTASADPWPYQDGSLHLIVSNQVLEHVFDHPRFFAETYRTLAVGGYSAHLFPILHNVWEPHLLIPLAHRVRQHHARVRWIKAMSRLGLGRFRAHRDQLGMSIDAYAQEHADYLAFMTNYKSWSDLLAICKAAGLRADYQFTERYYYGKLRSRMGKPPRIVYPPSSGWGDVLSRLLFRRISSVTLNTEKRQTYAR